jgi:competence protein ComGC
LEKVKLIEEKGNEAKVEFVQITTKIKGPEFKNNQTTGIHTLKKDGDSWKIFSTEVTDLKFL